MTIATGGAAYAEQPGLARGGRITEVEVSSGVGSDTTGVAKALDLISL